MNKRNQLNDWNDITFEYKSKQKRERNKAITFIVILGFIMALLFFIGERLTKEAQCVELSHGYYIHDACGNTERCCVSVKWNIKYLSTTI